MIFRYKATTPEGEVKTGTIDAASTEIAISALQRRNLIIVSLKPIKSEGKFGSVSSLFTFNSVKQRDVVILSRQLSTLFEAKVPVLSSLKLLSDESENPAIREKLGEVSRDIQGGASLSQAMAKHPTIFSQFYVSMVKAGEESGKLDEIFIYLADYLERSYDLSSKALRALIYPAFVMAAFIGVIILMMVVVIPKLGEIIKESGTPAPVYTQVVLTISDFLRAYGPFFLIICAVGAFVGWRYVRTQAGKIGVSRMQLSVPYLGDFYSKFYISRISDNLETLLTGGVSMVRSLEISADVVGNEIYKSIMLDTLKSVRSGVTLSESLGRYQEIPRLMCQMVKIGEESGKLDFILKTVSRFYKREVDAALDTMVNMIEPIMIIFLGGGVGLLMAAVLVPIYNIAMTIQ
jgi:type IV pilus assembly protein PilC